jgi:hypothetical protein
MKKLLTTLALAGCAMLQAQTIAIVNRTSSVSDTTLKAVANAAAAQVHNEYKRAWGKDATFKFVGRNQNPSSGNWVINITQSDGDYHSVNGSNLPYGRVHVSGVSYDYWTNSVSHEVLELRTNPFVNQTRKKGSQTISLEVCDACETNDQGYRISGQLMSDFVYPAWFGGNSGPFDQRRLISRAWQVLPGGYLPVE